MAKAPGSALVSQFLDDVTNDPLLLEEYYADPVARMTRYGLSQPDQWLILNGSPAAIREKIQQETEAEAIVYVLRMIPPP
jgi:hypothetical protein